MPVFSLVIPTRNRPELANTTLARSLAQTWRDFEIIVLENSDEPSLNVWEQRDARIRVVPARTTLSMPDNWERGLDLVRGDYVLYLSDKDWLVPHALDELATLVTTRSRPAIVNIRKACWGRDYGLAMQQGTGRVAALPSALVLSSWFSGVNHLHNAPMVYNSIVDRGLIDAVRARCGGRFFHGTAPDVASSLLLLANTPEYVVLDRIHVMAYFGSWSIGSAQMRQGRGGANAPFADEFRTDPLAVAGLVWSVTGVVAETLMACKRADLKHLGCYKINWGQYIRNCLDELAQRAAGGQDTNGDVAVLRAGVSRLYSWTTCHRTVTLRRLRAYLRWLRDETPLKVLSPVHARWRRMTARPAPTPPIEDPAVSFGGNCYRPMLPASMPEEAFEMILKDQTLATPKDPAHAG